MLLSACASMIGLHAAAGLDQSARLSGYKAGCEGNLVLASFDGQPGATRFSASAGEHSMEICYQSDPFWREDPAHSVNELCVDMVEYKVVVQARPALSYRFYVDGNPLGERSLMVLESLEPGSVESKAVEAGVEKLSSRPICYPMIAPEVCMDVTTRVCEP